MQINKITKYTVDGYKNEFNSFEEAVMFKKKEEIKALFDHFIELNDSIDDPYDICSDDVADFVLENLIILNEIVENKKNV